jgi:rRNA maturation endonuclease Nob1
MNRDWQSVERCKYCSNIRHVLSDVCPKCGERLGCLDIEHIIAKRTLTGWKVKGE